MLINVKMPTAVGILIFISMIINVNMPTAVGILIFMSMINAISEHLKAKQKSLFLSILDFMSI